MISLFDLETLKFKRHIPFGHKSSGLHPTILMIVVQTESHYTLAIFLEVEIGRKVFLMGVVEFDIDNPSKSLELYKDLWMFSPEFLKMSFMLRLNERYSL